jgi:DNA invertase Pin-like site-specific DNA recombinase
MKRQIKDNAYNQLSRKDPKRVAIYIRVSHDEQVKHGLSLESQKKTLEEYCKKHGHRVVGTYIDEGLTARKTLNKRLEFKRMIEDVKEDKIDLIVFIKLDRWFRNVRDYYNTMDILEAHNCTWIATEEDYDLSTSTGRLNLNIRLSISQNESDQTSDRINFVFANNRAEGRVVSGSCPFGYRIEDKRYVIHDGNAEKVRDIFDHFTKHGSLMKTLTYFRDKYNCRLSYNAIKKYVRNTAYIGEYRTEKGELIEDYTPAIIDRDTFDYAQTLMRKNIKQTRGKSDPSEFIFTGLLKCNTCGSTSLGIVKSNEITKVA